MKAQTATAVRLVERGEIRAAPGARWVPFTAEETIDTEQSSFRWIARMGAVTVTDAYEEGHGWLGVKAGGLVPLRKVTGENADRGELQRYLANILLCPAILVNNHGLEVTPCGARTLRVRDRNDPLLTTIDIDVDEQGRPFACRADRPRQVGSQAIVTPWSASASEWREWNGYRVPTKLEATWHLADGPFTYVRIEITDVTSPT